jgi:2-amino-4-hydroxy-6-hydroxymethyldihydropteridine diphosphokinase
VDDQRQDLETPSEGAVEDQVFVALGSNLGDRDAHLEAAHLALCATDGVEVIAASSVYETDPVGPPPQGPYLNAVIQLRTVLSPVELLDRLLEIETLEGRRRGPQRDAARTLDLDLLFFGERVIRTANLEVPHPRLAERAFVLMPLSDLARNFVHPMLGESIGTLAARVYDPQAVRLRAPHGASD